jgi:hypothetical protein
MKPKSNKDLVKLYYEELWNKNKKEYIETLFDDNITFHGSLDINTVGKQEFANYMDKILTGIPNLFHGVEIMVRTKESSLILSQQATESNITVPLFLNLKRAKSLIFGC